MIITVICLIRKLHSSGESDKPTFIQVHWIYKHSLHDSVQKPLEPAHFFRSNSVSRLALPRVKLGVLTYEKIVIDVLKPPSHCRLLSQRVVL